MIDKNLNINTNNPMSTREGHAYKRYHARKSHAKKNNIPFNITIEYALSLLTDTCPILNIPLSWCERSVKVTDNSPTLDKIHADLGYVIGNIAWISNRANRIKNDGNALEHDLIARFMRSKE